MQYLKVKARHKLGKFSDNCFSNMLRKCFQFDLTDTVAIRARVQVNEYL